MSKIWFLVVFVSIFVSLLFLSSLFLSAVVVAGFVDLAETGKKALELIQRGKPEEAYKYYGNGFKLGMLDGDLVNGTISVSESAGGIKEINTCAEVINEIMKNLENQV